jgi:phosphatidylglycerol:prolipoprotein diacylglycerol transferase
MYVHNLDPVLIDLGFLAIRWYSLSYILGIVAGWWLGKKIISYRSNLLNIDFNYKNFDDLISWLIISIILGGRFGYIIFYNFNYYLINPIDIFKIWEGGMSFHGALLGVILATYLFSSKIKLKPLFLLDIIACVAPIGLFFGRIANFINAELYGKPAEVFWSVIFPKIDNLPRHPSQLYEALLEGVVLFLILIFLIFRKNYKTGFCAFYFLIFYGLFRIVAEQFREPDIHLGYLFGNISMGTYLSMVMILMGAFFLRKVIKNEFK